MLDDLRKNQKGVIWAIAIIFIAGMGVMGIVEIFQPQPFVGKIYGKKVYRSEFEQMYADAVRARRQQTPDMTLDAQMLQSINDETWNNLVARTIFDKQVKRYRIKVRDADVREKFRSDPPRDVQEMPAFQTNGVFDRQKYFEIVAEDRVFALQLEQYIRATLPYELLERKIKSQVVVTEDSVRVDWLAKNERATGRVITFEWNRVEEQEVTDAEIQAYHTKNSSKYRKEATRKYRYVTMPFVASREDTLNVYAEIQDIYQQVLQGEDFAMMAEMHSDDPSARGAGGSLGFFGRGRMVPEFEEVAFDMEIGDISAPFQTNFGYHFLMVTDKRTNDFGEEEVEASHILKRVEPSDMTAMYLDREASILHERAEQIGLEKAAEEMGLEVIETDEFFADATFIQGIGAFPYLVKEAFSRRLGYLIEPQKLQNGSFVIAELSHRQGAHIQPLEQVSEVIKREIDREKRLVIIRQRANEMFENFTADEWLAQADSLGFRVANFNNIIITQSIPIVGQVKTLNQAIFDIEEEGWTELIMTDEGTYRAFISARMHPDIENFQRDIERLTNEYRTAKENAHYTTWSQKIFEEAKVEDLRAKYRFN